MSHTRREFLTGVSLRSEAMVRAQAAGDALLEAGGRPEPMAETTVRLATRAMASDFAVILNPGSADQVASASAALELVHVLENQMSVFREGSELSRLNRMATAQPVRVEPRLFELLLQTNRGADRGGLRSDGRPDRRAVATVPAPEPNPNPVPDRRSTAPDRGRPNPVRPVRSNRPISGTGGQFEPGRNRQRLRPGPDRRGAGEPRAYRLVDPRRPQ
ncbi:MAG: FAD:protein FMN transferase [Planctomycetes bacterium]|nr:FAD:protein FMN transferase [Planctomycetota bacterium]